VNRSLSYSLEKLVALVPTVVGEWLALEQATVKVAVAGDLDVVKVEEAVAMAEEMEMEVAEADVAEAEAEVAEEPRQMASIFPTSLDPSRIKSGELYQARTEGTSMKSASGSVLEPTQEITEKLQPQEPQMSLLAWPQLPSRKPQRKIIMEELAVLLALEEVLTEAVAEEDEHPVDLALLDAGHYFFCQQYGKG
jgi:hypothetical protein